jgi:hypothetical protein
MITHFWSLRRRVDTALTAAFGWAQLTRFEVYTEEKSAFAMRTVGRHAPLVPHDGILELVAA